MQLAAHVNDYVTKRSDEIDSKRLMVWELLTPAINLLQISVDKYNF